MNRLKNLQKIKLGVMLLGKIKLYDVAKELNLTSKEVLEIAKKLNIEAKSHLSSIDEADANKIKESVKNLTAKKPEKKRKMILQLL